MRVLLIEDYPPLQKSIHQGLHEAGFAVDRTGDGQEGLWYAMHNDYDVIILDLMLPGLDGLKILKKIRAKGRQAHVLILTAKDTLEDRITGLDMGADDYLVKPFAFEELLARIHALVRRRYQEKNPTLKIQDLRLDQAAQRVWRGRRRYRRTHSTPPQRVADHKASVVGTALADRGTSRTNGFGAGRRTVERVSAC